MKNYIDEISMRQASIFELRNLARDMGVNSPTIYKKEELIAKILKIANGEEKPQMPKSRQGRPPKKMHTYIDEKQLNVLNGLSKNDCNNILKKALEDKDFDSAKLNNSWVLACPNTYNYESVSEDTSFCFEQKQGYLQIMEDGVGFIFQMGRCANADTAVFVSKKDIELNKLKSGDFIECVCKKVHSNSTRYLAEIKSINKIDYKKYNATQRTNFDDCVIANKPTGFLFDKSEENSALANVKVGARNILKCKSLCEFENIFKNLLCQNKAYNVVALCLEVLPEQEGLLKFGANFESFYTMYGDTERQNNLTIGLAVERVKRLAEENKEVVFIVNDLGKLIKFQNFALGNDAYEIKYKSLNNVFKVLTLARQMEENDVTVLACFKDNVFYENLYKIEEEFENLNCVVLNI